MQEIEKNFAKLVGEAIAKRWTRQQQKRRQGIREDTEGQEDHLDEHEGAECQPPTSKAHLI